MATPFKTARITGSGIFVPPDVYSNHDLESMMATSDEWIRQRSGIATRHIAKSGVGPADLALPAAQEALRMAGLKPSDLDLIIFATLSPDYYFPGSGVFLQQALGCGTIPALDIRAQCSGFIYGMHLIRSLIATGCHERILLVGAEVHSHLLNFTTAGRDMAVLFGDGAGAVIFEASDNRDRGIFDVEIHSDGLYRDALKLEFPSSRHDPMISKEIIDQGLHFPKMDGKQVFKHAVNRVTEVVGSILNRNNLTADDINHFVFHQANIRINEAVLKYLNQPASKCYNNIDRYGNCSAASIPMCIAEQHRSGAYKEGDLICFGGFGAGFTWGSALMRW